jgi:hypothetical protein
VGGPPTPFFVIPGTDARINPGRVEL